MPFRSSSDSTAPQQTQGCLPNLSSRAWSADQWGKPLSGPCLSSLSIRPRGARSWAPGDTRGVRISCKDDVPGPQTFPRNSPLPHSCGVRRPDLLGESRTAGTHLIPSEESAYGSWVRSEKATPRPARAVPGPPHHNRISKNYRRPLQRHTGSRRGPSDLESNGHHTELAMDSPHWANQTRSAQQKGSSTTCFSSRGNVE